MDSLDRFIHRQIIDKYRQKYRLAIDKEIRERDGEIERLEIIEIRENREIREFRETEIRDRQTDRLGKRISRQDRFVRQRDSIGRKRLDREISETSIRHIKIL